MSDEQKDAITAAGTGLLMFVVYALAAPTALCGADNAEFVTLSVRDGIAHPPGYPLYTLYLRAMSWIPGAGAAHTAGLATALLGGLTVAVLALAGLRWRIPRVPSALGALLVGVELHVFEAHTHAEVFALNHLIAASILCVAAPGGSRPIRKAALLGLLAGLGLSNHHSIVLLAPVGLWALFCAVRDAERRVLALLAALACGVLGLLPYASLLLSPECVDCTSWGSFAGPADVWHHFLRGDYGTTTLGIGGERAPLEHVAAFGGAVLAGSWVLVPLGVVAGVVALFRRGDRAEAGALLVTVLLCGPVFVALFNTTPEGIGADIVARFYALPVVAAAVLAMAALSLVPRGAQTAVALVVVGLAFVNGHAASQQCTGILDQYARDLVAPLPADAIVFGTGDHRTFGVGYVQHVEGARPDVDWIDAKMLAYDWYVTRLETRLGAALPRSTDSDIPLAGFLAAAHATSRPVYVSHIFTDSLAKLPSYPIGPVIRLVEPGGRPMPPTALAAENAALLDRLAVKSRPADLRSPWEQEVFQHYARPWISLEEAFRQLGDTQSASKAAEVAATFR